MPNSKNKRSKRKARQTQVGGATVLAGRRSAANPTQQMISAPLLVGVNRTNTGAFPRFGQAPVRPSFPEGGLRMSGTATPYYYLHTPNSTSYGAFGTNATSRIYTLVNPTGAYYNGTYDYTLLDNSSALPNISAFFRCFRFRKLVIEYIPTIGTNESDSELKQRITLAWTPDSQEILQDVANVAQFDRPRAVSFPSWEPFVFTAIDDGKLVNDKDAPLYPINAIQDVYSTVGLLNSNNQGALIWLGSDLVATSSKRLGNLILHYVIDLYGFASVKITTNTFEDIPLKQRLEKKRICDDQKSSRPEVGRVSADLGFVEVELPPVQSRTGVSTTPAPTPQGVDAGRSQGKSWRS
jgi:hypothetical protein